MPEEVLSLRVSMPEEVLSLRVSMYPIKIKIKHSPSPLEVHTEGEGELTCDATKVVKETTGYRTATAGQTRPPDQVAHPSAQDELGVQRGLWCREHSVRAWGGFWVRLQLRVGLVVADVGNIAEEAGAAHSGDGVQGAVLGHRWV